MDLYAVPLHGGAAPKRLNGSLPVTQRFPNPDAEIDSTGRWVLFHAAPDHPDAVELFVAPLHGLGAPLRVNAPLAGVGPASVTGTFRPGSSAVPYIADQDEAGVFELYVTEVVGTRSHGALPR